MCSTCHWFHWLQGLLIQLFHFENDCVALVIDKSLISMVQGLLIQLFHLLSFDANPSPTSSSVGCPGKQSPGLGEPGDQRRRHHPCHHLHLMVQCRYPQHACRQANLFLLGFWDSDPIYVSAAPFTWRSLKGPLLQAYRPKKLLNFLSFFLCEGSGVSTRP